ncbi:MAG: hypothetical protein ACMG50_02620 [Thermomonas sp.]
MNRYSVIGYLLTAAAITADLAILGGAVNSLHGTSTLLVGQTMLLALVPAAILLAIGAKRSAGRAHRIIGYVFSGVDALLAISACVSIVLIASGQTNEPAA